MPMSNENKLEFELREKIDQQAAEIAKLRAFVRRFREHIENCEHCDGVGYRKNSECLECYGKGLRIVSMGTLVDLTQDADEILSERTKTK